MTSRPYVFISYAHLDSDIVLPCVNAIKQGGIDLWYDEGIEAGSEWPEFIAEKVVDCTKFVLFVSKAYLDSQNCKRELNFAISRKKDILSIFIEDVNLSPGMEMQLGTYQAIHKKRFENETAFHNSICKEAFFNPCRSGSIPNTPPPTPNPTSAATSAFTNSYSRSTFNYNSGSAYTAPAPKNTDSLTMPTKNKYVAALLAFFLGGFGVHKFYLKQISRGILYLIFCWTYVPGIIAFFEGIFILCSSSKKLTQKYNCYFE